MIAAVLAAVMFAVGLDNAWFWTILLFLLCFIPMIGVTVGSIVPALFALLQFESWWPAAVIFGGIQAVAFIVGNFIYPRLQAETQNINPIATLLALSFWGSLWGLTGAFLAVPLTLMVMMAFAYFDRTRWIAVLLSDDGKPSVPKGLGEKPPAKRARAASTRFSCRSLLAPNRQSADWHPRRNGALPMCDSDNHQGFIADTSLTRRSVVILVVVGCRCRGLAGTALAARRSSKPTLWFGPPTARPEAVLFHPAGHGSWPAVLMWPDILGLGPCSAKWAAGWRQRAIPSSSRTPSTSQRAPVVTGAFDFGKTEDRSNRYCALRDS